MQHGGEIAHQGPEKGVAGQGGCTVNELLQRLLVLASLAPQPCLIERALDHRGETIEPGFVDVIGGPAGQGLDGQLFFDGAGNEDERHFRAFMMRDDERGHAVEGRQIVVGKYDRVCIAVERGNIVIPGLHALPFRGYARVRERCADKGGIATAVFQMQNAQGGFHEAPVGFCWQCHAWSELGRGKRLVEQRPEHADFTDATSTWFTK